WAESWCAASTRRAKLPPANAPLARARRRPNRADVRRSRRLVLPPDYSALPTDELAPSVRPRARGSTARQRDSWGRVDALRAVHRAHSSSPARSAVRYACARQLAREAPTLDCRLLAPARV